MIIRLKVIEVMRIIL